MKDYSQYSYSELYGMLNHMNQFKYPDRVALLEQEIGQRVERGEIPIDLVPKFKLNKQDFLFLLRSFGVLLYIILLSGLSYVLVNSAFHDGQFSGAKDYFFAFNTLILMLTLIQLKFLKSIKYLRVILLVYLFSSLVAFGVIVGFNEFQF